MAKKETNTGIEGISLMKDGSYLCSYYFEDNPKLRRVKKMRGSLEKVIKDRETWIQEDSQRLQFSSWKQFRLM